MKAIDKGRDELLKCDYTLYSVKYFELMELAKSWYPDINFKDFDNRNVYLNDRNSQDLKIIKLSGLISNHFYGYKEGDRFYLLDGFNRLFTDYGKIETDTTIYIKIIDEPLEDYKLMTLMFVLNLWKLSARNYGGFELDNFLDRGFRLLLKTKFNIDLYNYDDYRNRVRNERDLKILDMYFRDECLQCDSFKYDIKYVAMLFNNKNIIRDFKELIDSNDYLEKEFRNYEMFLDGFAKFLSRRRLKSDDSDYKFKDFLELLYKDKKFFTKLKEMSGNDATRKNIFKFYSQFEK